jgi:hypothetical protein
VVRHIRVLRALFGLLQLLEYVDRFHKKLFK